MKNNQYSNILYGLIGYLIAAFIGLFITIYCIVRGQSWASILIFAVMTIFFFAYYFYQIVQLNKNGVDIITAICIDVKRTSLGYGATNSKTYVFQIQDQPKDLNIDDNTFELQIQEDTGNAITYSIFKKNLHKPRKNSRKLILKGSQCKLYFMHQKNRDHFIPSNRTLLGYEVIYDEEEINTNSES